MRQFKSAPRHDLGFELRQTGGKVGLLTILNRIHCVVREARLRPGPLQLLHGLFRLPCFQ